MAIVCRIKKDKKGNHLGKGNPSNVGIGRSKDGGGHQKRQDAFNRWLYRNWNDFRFRYTTAPSLNTHTKLRMAFASEMSVSAL